MTTDDADSTDSFSNTNLTNPTNKQYHPRSEIGMTL